jgi:hypothetical protein
MEGARCPIGEPVIFRCCAHLFWTIRWPSMLCGHVDAVQELGRLSKL